MRLRRTPGVRRHGWSSLLRPSMAAALALSACGASTQSVSGVVWGEPGGSIGSFGTPTPGFPALAFARTPTGGSDTAATPAAGLPNWSHVYVIYFENKEYSQIIGSSAAPYINSLVSKYGLATNFYAERHPSEPNYIAFTSGGTQGIADDGVYNLSVNNLYSQVEASGRTWHEYEQGIPSGCFTGSSSSAVVDGVGKSGAYVRKHNPAISYTSVSGNPAECSKITQPRELQPRRRQLQLHHAEHDQRHARRDDRRR